MDTAPGRHDGWRRIAGAVADPNRPVVFAAAFWLFLATNVVVETVNYSHAPQRFGTWTLLAATGALAAAWLILPWDQAATFRHKLGVPLFLAAGLATLWVTTYGGAALPLLVGLGNAVILFGLPRALLYAIPMLAAVFVGTLTYPGHHLADAVYQTAAFTVVAGFAVAVAAAFAELRRRREELAAAHAELRRSAARIRELTLAQERARMAREMHDSVGHHLTVIKMGLENAERFRTRRPEEAWREVRQAKELTQQAFDEVRRWVRALRPLSLERHAATEAMAALAESFASAGVQVRFAVAGAERPLDADTELVLYRALQEGLTNALRHSGATLVRASLTFGSDRVELAVEDDGTGAREANGDQGFGLSSLAERALAVGGRLAAGNRSPDGFALRVEVPATGP